MSKLALLRRGILAASRGDFATIARHICNKIPEAAGSNVQSYTVVEEYQATSWLSTDSLRCIQYDTQTSKYRTVVSGLGFEIGTAEPFNQLQFTILGLNGTERLSVRVATGDSGPEEVTQISFARDDVSRYEFCTQFDKPRTAVTVAVQPEISSSEQSDTASDRVTVTIPTVRRPPSKPPIFILSIDSLRYDHQTALEPLLSALGDDLQVPAEPRTRGHWTPPSHGSLFTGTHPGDHEYIGWDDENNYILQDEITTLGEILAEHGYTSSGIAANTRILPEFGFGRGFDRFKLNRMIGPDWITRETDVQTSVSDMLRWIDEDTAQGNRRVCYFLHAFDPHAPYVPPPRFRTGGLDYEEVRDFRKDYKSKYIENYKREPQSETDLYRQIMEFYHSSVNYTAQELSRIPRELKQRGVFDESLIIVLGDHGEEFGERGFYGHNSLYDANIRPFLGIKPPAEDQFDVPDRVNYIDLLPTIAECIGASVPDSCRGRPLQHVESQRPRITERIRPDWYNIAVEIGGHKGIFTYESNYPRRPDGPALERSPVLSEFYDISAVRDGDFADKTDQFSNDLKEKLRQAAVEFVQTSERRESISTTDQTPAEETLDHLEDLGYR